MSLELHTELVLNLKQQLETIDNSTDDIIEKFEKSYEVSYQALCDLKKLFLSTSPLEIDDEIYFFKNIKPFVLSKVIVFAELYSLEVKKPNYSKKVLLKYYKKYIKKHRKFIDTNIEFFNYYRSNVRYYDKQYFTRSKVDLRLYPDAAYFCTDTEFSTSHDTKLATLKAYIEIKMYVKQEILEIDNEKYLGNHSVHNNLRWTANKSDLVELIYAIQGTNAVNNGNVTLKELTDFFNIHFNLNIGDYSRVYYDLQLRSQKTKFLDNLKAAFESKIEMSLSTRG